MYNGTTLNIGVIPEYYLGYKVLQIDENAFAGYSSNVNVLVNNSVERVGYAAFGNYGNNLNTMICGFVAAIDENGFTPNTSINYIDSYAFSNLAYFNMFNLGGLEHLTYIGNYAFQNTLLVNVVIPASVEYIGQNAFKGCAIYSLSFEDGNEDLEIDDFAFYDAMRDFGNAGSRVSNSVAYTPINIFNQNLPVKSDVSSYVINLPSRLKTVGKYAFMQFCFDGCSSGIKSIVINSEIEDIGDGAFSIEGLESISIFDSNSQTQVSETNDQKYSIDNQIFYEQELGDKVKVILVVAKYNQLGDTLEIISGIKSIGDYAFLGFENSTIKNLVLPSSLEDVGFGAFITHTLENNKIEYIIFNGDLPTIPNDSKPNIRRQGMLFGNVKIIVNYANFSSITNILDAVGELEDYLIIKLDYQSSMNLNPGFNIVIAGDTFETVQYESLADLISNGVSVTTQLVDNQTYYCKIIAVV